MNQQFQNFRQYGNGSAYGNFGGSPNQNQKHLRGRPRRMLMRELVQSKESGTELVGYSMGVVQSPLRKDSVLSSRQNARYDGLEHGDPDLAPWAVLKSRFKRYDEVTFPISLCTHLHRHLLSCAQLHDGNTGTSANTEGNDPVFDLSKLVPAEFCDRDVNCSLKVLSKRPTMSTDDSTDEDGKVRRWLQAGPITQTEGASTNGENGSRPLPVHLRTVCLEIYESLLPNLIAFISDICVRYQALGQPPQVKYLYSPSGERRYFFDIHNTRYGNRLHISQVTDFHRSVIGIPLESLVTFRDRLTQLIDVLKLEDGKHVREALEKYSSRPVRRRPIRPTSCSQSATMATVDSQHMAQASLVVENQASSKKSTKADKGSRETPSSQHRNPPPPQLTAKHHVTSSESQTMSQDLEPEIKEIPIEAQQVVSEKEQQELQQQHQTKTNKKRKNSKKKPAATNAIRTEVVEVKEGSKDSVPERNGD
ncbi:unnamed protein product [Mesocestoides corti]|uniref:Protein kinase domain-containing protein n=1 Tax=Mesocestoides corti TaxID=53468 RepID=A0A0R3UKS1_MESCO|nr:unnamed protein product [Mesocestoides corti]